MKPREILKNIYDKHDNNFLTNKEVTKIINTLENIDDVNESIGDKTPLFFAIEKKSLPLIRYLVEKRNLNINTINIENVSCLEYVITTKDSYKIDFCEIARYLAKKQTTKLTTIFKNNTYLQDTYITGEGFLFLDCNPYLNFNSTTIDNLSDIITYRNYSEHNNNLDTYLISQGCYGAVNHAIFFLEEKLEINGDIKNNFDSENEESIDEKIVWLNEDFNALIQLRNQIKAQPNVEFFTSLTNLKTNNQLTKIQTPQIKNYLKELLYKTILFSPTKIKVSQLKQTKIIFTSNYEELYAANSNITYQFLTTLKNISIDQYKAFLDLYFVIQACKNESDLAQHLEIAGPWESRHLLNNNFCGVTYDMLKNNIKFKLDIEKTILRIKQDSASNNNAYLSPIINSTNTPMIINQESNSSNNNYLSFNQSNSSLSQGQNNINPFNMFNANSPTTSYDYSDNSDNPESMHFSFDLN